MERVLLSRLTGLCNRGLDAQVRVVAAKFPTLFPGAKLSALSDHGPYDTPRLASLGIETVLNRTGGRWAHRPGRSVLLGARVLPRLGSRRAAARDAIAQADLVVAIGGDVFSSDYRNDLYLHLAPLRIAQELGRPCALLAHSIGPFDGPEHRDAFVAMARRCQLVSVRDQPSLDYCLELGLPAELIRRTADPAFLLEPLTGEAADQLRAYYDVDGAPTVGLALSQAMPGYGGVDAQVHLATWIRVIQRFLDRGTRVLLVPHVQNCSDRDDDRTLASALVRHFAFNPAVRLVGADHDSAELKTLLGACELVIGERMHATIAALSSGVPALFVSYSVKSRGLAQDVYGRTEGVVAPAALLSESDASIDFFLSAWERRQDLQAEVVQALGRMRNLAEQGFRDLADRCAAPV